jgi:transposase
VALCQTGDRSIGQVSKDLDLTVTSVREWVRRAEVDAGCGRPGELTTVERDERKSSPYPVVTS